MCRVGSILGILSAQGRCKHVNEVLTSHKYMDHRPHYARNIQDAKTKAHSSTVLILFLKVFTRHKYMDQRPHYARNIQNAKTKAHPFIYCVNPLPEGLHKSQIHGPKNHTLCKEYPECKY